MKPTWALGLVLCVVAASGCAKARAASAPDGPPLQVPQPPARVLIPLEEPIAGATAAAPVPAAAPDPAPPATAATRTPPRPAEPARPQPAPPAAATAPPQT